MLAPVQTVHSEAVHGDATSSLSHFCFHEFDSVGSAVDTTGLLNPIDDSVNPKGFERRLSTPSRHGRAGPEHELTTTKSGPERGDSACRGNALFVFVGRGPGGLRAHLRIPTGPRASLDAGNLLLSSRQVPGAAPSLNWGNPRISAPTTCLC